MGQSTDSILPVNLEAERSILGAVLLDNTCFSQAAAMLKTDDFSLDSHRRIYGHMRVLGDSNRPIDFVTLTEELGRNRELEAIGGVAYITSLTDGLPRVQNIEHYIRIVRDKAILRGVIHAANQAIQAAVEQSESATEVLATAESAFFHLSDQRLGNDFTSVQEIYEHEIGDLQKLYNLGKDLTGLRTYFDDFESLPFVSLSELLFVG